MDNKSHPFNVIAQLATLRRYARSLVRNQNDVEDLVHDALVRAYERKSTFRKGANIRNWLLSIVHNTHIVRLRQVQQAFFDLPEEQREALHLVAIEELSYQEAADALGIPVGTLMSRVS